jgi:hypothetical protein
MIFFPTFFFSTDGVDAKGLCLRSFSTAGMLS